MLNIDLVVNAITTLLVTIDPPGLAPIFLGLTVGMTRPQRKQVALRGSIIAFCILAVFALTGAGVLSLLEELVLSFSIAKWAKELLTMGSGIRRAITLIDKAITFIKNLNNVIPPMLKAASVMAIMFKALNLAFMLPMSAGQQADAGLHVDDTAAAGF